MIMQDIKTYRNFDTSSNETKDSAIMVGTLLAALALFVGIGNIHNLGEGETGEYMKNGKSLSTTTEKGFYFTKPLSGVEFVKWKKAAKETTFEGTTLDGKSYKANVSADYTLPSTYQMEDHTRTNHFFTTGVARAFNETVGNTMSSELKGQNLTTVMAEFCAQAAKNMGTVLEGSTVKKPQNVSCSIRNS